MAFRPRTSTSAFLRKNIRLLATHYHGRKMYFLTLCFADRRPFGKNPHLASWLAERLRTHAANAAFFVHAYCVMPDHLHALLCAASDSSDFTTFVERYKQQTAFAFAQRTHRPLWQSKYYDRILRHSDSPESVAWYIWLNPVRQNLCRAPLDYPHLGSFTQIGTKMLQGSQAPNWTPPWKPKV